MTESDKRIPPFGLRLPPDLKDRVQSAAKENQRSMNAEIIARLERSFEAQSPEAFEQFMRDGEQMATMMARIEGIAKVIRSQIGDDAADEMGL